MIQPFLGPKIATHISDIIERPPAQLKAWPNSPRKHSVEQRFRLKESIRRYGFTAPVLTDDQLFILAGHERVETAKELGLETVPTRMISGLSQAAKRAYVMADNKLAELSSWNLDLLKSEMELLIQEDFEVELTGFSTAEVDTLLSISLDGSDAEDIPPVPALAVSMPGDLWLLGKHRLLCASALDEGAYAALLQGEQVQMCITDPPYNVKIDGHVCGGGKVKHKDFLMAAGEMSSEQFEDFLHAAFKRVHACSAPGAVCFFFMDWRHVPELLGAAVPVFGEPRQLCVWNKDNAGMGSFYRSKHELVYVFKCGTAPHINNFGLGKHRYRSNVWEYPSTSNELLKLHPTVKPISLIADAIRDCSTRHGIVLDPFCGSGTILLAAERTTRVARAIELDPAYVDVAVKRWQQMTGIEATLPTGQTWSEVAAERLGS